MIISQKNKTYNNTYYKSALDSTGCNNFFQQFISRNFSYLFPIFNFDSHFT